MKAISDLVKNYIPATWRTKAETKAQSIGQLAAGEASVDYWERRFGWSTEVARFLGTAVALGIRENAEAVLLKAQEMSESEQFGEEFAKRVQRDPSIIGATLESAKFTTDDELRGLLGRILAGDIDKPGSVSRRAVSVATDLTIRDLQEFLKLRPVTWRSVHPDTDGCLLVLGPREQQYGSVFLSFDSEIIGVDFHTFGEFQQLGLLQERYEGNAITMKTPESDESESSIQLRNGNRTIGLVPITEEPTVQLGVFAFTKAGSEIISLFLNEEFSEIDGYFEEVCASWCNNGVGIVEVRDSPEK